MNLNLILYLQAFSLMLELFLFYKGKILLAHLALGVNLTLMLIYLSLKCVI